MEKDQVLGSEEELVIMAKGKRTKRLRLLSPNNCVAATATCIHASANNNSEDSSSTTTYESDDEEDQDMANCLILLARGGGSDGLGDSLHNQKQQDNHDGDGDNNNNGVTLKFAEMGTATKTPKGGLFIYECRTCNRTFPSFQALGGHRASHKKHKLMIPEEKKPSSPPQPPVVTKFDHFEGGGTLPHIKISPPPISFKLESHTNRSIFNGNKAKIHECSICGSEFTSGQALGGHMRRHRATTNTTTQILAEAKVEVVRHRRNMLELDLNLPAPEEDLRESKFQFPANQKSMVLSASRALIDCHH